jgi:hypothetical protein
MRRLWHRLAWSVIVVAPCVTASAAFDQKNSKIIEWGWDTAASAPNGNPWAQPNIPANISTYESQLAFDGVAVDMRKNTGLTNGTGDFYGWNDFGSTTLSTSTYSNNIAALQSTPFQRYTANSISMKVVPGNVDWYDNTGFNAINANGTTAATIIHNTTGGTTVFLDIEDYQGHLWWYDNFSTTLKSAHTYAQYQSQVRLRGQQFMAALQAAYPNVTLMLTDGYERPDPSLQGHNDQNGLVPSFIDGLLDGATGGTTVLDGYEYSYSFRNASQFESAYNDMRVNQRNVSANQAAYDAHYRASFGLWLDYNSPTIPWSSTNPSTNYFTPDKFRFAVQQAAMRSDGQVWIYSQTPSWYYPTVAWSNGMAVPQAYKDALAKVRRTGKLERFNGTLADTTTWSLHSQSGASMAQNDILNLIASSGEADFTTNTITAGKTDMVSAEVTPTSSSGSAAIVGLAMTNDSGGAGNSTLNDTRMLFIEWSDAANKIFAGFSDSTGANHLTAIANIDHPLNHTYVYQIERLDSNNATFSIYDATGGALVGTPVTLTFSGVPDNLKPALFSQSANASFDNLFIASQVPEPASASLVLLALSTCTTRPRRRTVPLRV